MVSELLAYARLEHAQPHLVAVPVNAQDWMASVVGAVAHEAEAGGIECVIPANGPETVTLEPRFMARAVINLLRNAVRYAQRRVEVRLELTDSGYHCVTVDDDGPGVRAADRARIFEPFTRVDEPHAGHWRVRPRARHRATDRGMARRHGRGRRFAARRCPFSC